MHMIVRFLVHATSEDAAVDAAVRAFETGLRDDHTTAFDYCMPMNRGHGTAGADRYTQYATTARAFPVTDEYGRKEVYDANGSTMEWALKHVRDVEAALANGAMALLDDYAARHSMASIGAEHTNSVYVYLYDAVRYGDELYPIASPARFHELIAVLYGDADAPSSGEYPPREEVWVVPLDCHH